MKVKVGTTILTEAPNSGNSLLDFYVSNAGVGGGHSSEAPMSPSALMATSLPANAKIYFNKGENFDIGAFNLTNGALITSYGSGLSPNIRGSINVGSQIWTDEGSGIWSTPCAQIPKWVFVNGVAAHGAESSWFNVTARPSNTTLTVSAGLINALPGSIVGSKMRSKQFNFAVSFEYTVTAYDSGTGNITVTPAIPGGYSAVNTPLKLLGQLQYVTANGDWYYDSSTTKLYYKSVTSPSGTDIRISIYDSGFVASGKSNITISNLNFIHYYLEGIRSIASSNILIDGCLFDQIRNDGVWLAGDSASITVQNSTISNCGSNAILIGVVNHCTFQDNIIHDIGMQANYPYPIRASAVGGNILVNSSDPNPAVFNACSDLTFKRNNCYNIACDGLNLLGPNHIIEDNLMHDLGQRFADGGAIHGIYRSFLDLHSTNWSIKNNIFYNCIGSIDAMGGSPTLEFNGIYMDNGCNNNLIDSNTVYACTSVGILLNFDTEQHIVTNNNVWDCGICGVKYRQNPGSSSPVYPNNIKNILTGNKFVCKTQNQRCVQVESYDGSAHDPWASGGSSDTNHYVQSYSTNICARQTAGGGARSDRTLSGWRTLYGYDASSTQFVNYLTDTNATNETAIQLNNTNSSVNYNPPDGFWDVFGSVQASVIIPAYFSYMYIRESPVVFVNAGGASSVASSGTSLAPGYPGGLINGDLLLMFVCTRSGPLVVNNNPPSGWTNLFEDLANGMKTYVYSKVSDGTETGTVALNFTGGSNVPRIARIFQFRNVKTSSYSESGAVASTSTGSTISPSSVTTTEPNGLALAFTGFGGVFTVGDFTGETGGNWTELIAESTNASGSGLTIQAQLAKMPNIGTISGGSLTISGSTFTITRTLALKRL